MGKKLISLTIFIMVAMATARPQEDTGPLTRMISDSTESRTIVKRSLDPSGGDTGGFRGRPTTDIPEVNMNIDMDDLSEYLRCTSCLTECLNVKWSVLGYFFCKNCIQTCSENTDAFMHFFSSHECTLASPKHGSSAPTPSEVMVPQSSPSEPHITSVPGGVPAPPISNDTDDEESQGHPDYYDYVDVYMSKRFFPKEKVNDRCALKQEKYNEMEYRYSQCMTELESCNSDRHTSSSYESLPEDDAMYYDYETAEYDGSYLDRERSNFPPGIETRPAPTGTEPTGSLPQVDADMFDRIRDLYPDLANLIMRNPTYMRNQTHRPTHMPTTTPKNLRAEYASAKLLQQHGSRFVTEEEFRNISRQRWDSNPRHLAAIKSIGGTRRPEESEEKRAVCPTRFKVVSPLKAVHHTRRFGVDLVVAGEKVQYFFAGECTFKKPTVSLTDRTAFCDEVYNIQKALFLVDAKRYKSDKSLRDNCEPYDDGSGRYKCDDWVRLPGACTLYL